MTALTESRATVFSCYANTHPLDPANKTAPMIPKYELIYFNFRARAELSRLLFALADVEYVDHRVTSIDEWLDLKTVAPFGQLPLLKVDGSTLCQSNTIARYLAKEFGFIGRSNLEQAKCDMVVDCVLDMLEPIMPCYREEDEKKKEEMRTNYEGLLPGFLEKMEAILKQNNCGDNYFVGDDITWADLAVMNAWHWIPGFGIFPKLHLYPKLEEHRQRIESHPRIQAWLDRRPKTPV